MKVQDISKVFSTSRKKLLFLIITLALVIALPLFVWAIINNNFNPHKKAASGEPTPTPISTPTPLPGNKLPIIRTSQLPIAYLAKSYSAVVEGYDKDMYDNLTMTVNNLPPGLSISQPCKSFVASGYKIVTCTVSGNPTKTGNFKINITLTDQKSPAITKTIAVPVLVVWDLNKTGNYIAPAGEPMVGISE
jgi:hypothetical protein